MYGFVVLCAPCCLINLLFIRFSALDIAPYAETLLTHLFRLIEAGQTPEKLSENDYLMRGTFISNCILVLTYNAPV